MTDRRDDDLRPYLELAREIREEVALLIAGEQDFSGSFGGDVILRFRFR